MGEVALFSKGQGYSKADLRPSGSPAFLYGQMYTDYRLSITDSNQYLPQGSKGIFSTSGDVIVPASGESAQEIAIASVVEKAGILLGGDLNIIKPNETILDSTFLALNASGGKLHNNLAARAQGKTIVHLHNPDIASSPIKFPTIPEQRLIGEFFSTLDSLIAAAERQEALLRQKKQAYLQLMFPCEGETQPRLRFSGFIQNWRMHRMSEMVAPLNSIQQIMPDRDIEYRLWSVPSFQLGVPENVRGSRIMSSKLVLERDDILLSKINPRIQRIWRVDSDGTLPDVGSTEWVVFRAKPSKASPLFLKALLSSPLFYRYMVSTEKGATGSQKRADKTLLMSSCYWLPSLSEQQRIGAFFHLVDATLLTVQRNLAGLKELKRAYLQRMFI